MSHPEPAPKRKKSRKKKFIVLFIVLGLIGGSGYMLSRTLTGPAVGTAVSSLPNTTRQQPIELEQFDGTTFSFVHPITYVEQNIKAQPNPNNLESRTFISTGMVSRVLTITVSKLPSNKLEDDASYTMRAQNPSKYQMRPAVLKNEKVVVATSSDGQQYQQVAFWAHEGKLMTFTMSGMATNTQAMTAEYNEMIGTISWR